MSTINYIVNFNEMQDALKNTLSTLIPRDDTEQRRIQQYKAVPVKIPPIVNIFDVFLTSQDLEAIILYTNGGYHEENNWVLNINGKISKIPIMNNQHKINFTPLQTGTIKVSYENNTGHSTVAYVSKITRG